MKSRKQRLKEYKAKEYIVHLLSELSNYILESHPSRMVISLHQEEDGLHLCLVDNCPRTEDELFAMRSALHPQARPELAEYYGAMEGSDLAGKARLNLIGWQVKDAQVARTANGTQIDLWMGGEKFCATQFTIPKKNDAPPPSGGPA